MTTTDSVLTHFECWLKLKFSYTKAKMMTKRELSRQTPDCIGAKLLITSTALRDYRNRQLGTLMRCCEAWKPIEDCFDTLSFECIDFLTRENLEAREAEVSTLPWTQTEKDIAQARCSTFNMKRFCGLFNKLLMTSIGLFMDRAEFDDLLVSKKDSAPRPDGIPYGVYRCAGGLGSKFLFNADQAVLEGRNIPDCFAESRTVFIPKTSGIDDNGRIIRSPDAPSSIDAMLL